MSNATIAADAGVQAMDALCLGEATAAAGLSATTRPAATTRNATLIQQSSCATPHRVWCLNASIASP